MVLRQMISISATFALIVGTAGAEQRSATISGTARVIDGDTISIRQQRVRIAGIDTCEMGQYGILNDKAWPCGLVARSHLRQLVDGKHITCRIVDIDRYKRSVGQCFIEDTDIGLIMVRTGQAEVMLYYLPRDHGIGVAEYKHAENYARERLMGIWAADVESPQKYRRANVY
ncbi:thermonuclease family protein [Brucella intermedia]|uniref:thermonuclease family protein n=1 Tax=Brucella intermedia TaxID=94625 RepID=UPI0031F32C00